MERAEIFPKNHSHAWGYGFFAISLDLVSMPFCHQAASLFYRGSDPSLFKREQAVAKTVSY